MDKFENPEKRIEWDDTHFFITDEGSLTVLSNDERFGLCDQESWENEVLDGPIADMRRLNSSIFGLGLADQVDTSLAVERMMWQSRSIFIKPLVELEAYARDYQFDPNQQTIL